MSYMSELHTLLQEHPKAADCPSCGSHLSLERVVTHRHVAALVDGKPVAVGINRLTANLHCTRCDYTLQEV